MTCFAFSHCGCRAFLSSRLQFVKKLSFFKHPPFFHFWLSLFCSAHRWHSDNKSHSPYTSQYCAHSRSVVSALFHVIFDSLRFLNSSRNNPSIAKHVNHVQKTLKFDAKFWTFFKFFAHCLLWTKTDSSHPVVIYGVLIFRKISRFFRPSWSTLICSNYGSFYSSLVRAIINLTLMCSVRLFLCSIE